jgi:hypothetical protein
LRHEKKGRLCRVHSLIFVEGTTGGSPLCDATPPAEYLNISSD